MSIILKQQELLFNWIGHHNCRRLIDISKACKELAENVNCSDKYSLYLFFYPLVRLGLLEYQGNDVYGLARPVIIFYQSNWSATGINLPPDLLGIITEEFHQVSRDSFGIIRFTGSVFKVEKFCEAHGISLNNLRVDEILERLPSIEDIVHQFEKVNKPANGWHYDLKKREWILLRLYENVGVYRTGEEPYAAKIFLDHDANVYSIPSQKNNPDALNIALCYQAALEGINYLSYNGEEHSLVVSRMQLPILLDRILRIPSFTEPLIPNTAYDYNVYKHISRNSFDQLKRILFINRKHLL